MELNSDFTRRASVHAASLEWTPSPIAGVERRMLDRIGNEVARATTIVRYAKDSHFPRHIHDGGEEYLVLDGVFQDEHGDYPVGSYVRNPPKSAHTPGSASGCVILVKLWQFDPDDRREVRIDTRDGRYIVDPRREGVETLPLFEDEHENVRLERWLSGAHIVLDVPTGLELLVLNGEFVEGGETFVRDSWLRVPPGSPLRATAGPEGCHLWIKASPFTLNPRFA